MVEREIDTEAADQGRRFHLDETKLKSCIEKQDTTEERASVVRAEQLGVIKTPTVFVNGAKSRGLFP